MKMIHCDVTEFQEDYHADPILCVGASAKLMEAVTDLNIAANVCAVADNATDKHGKMVQIGGRELMVHSVEQAIEEMSCYGEKWIILVTSRFYEAILEQLEHIQRLEKIRCYAYPCMQLFVRKGSNNYFYQRLIEPCVRTYCEVLKWKDVPQDEIDRLVAKKEEQLTAQMDGKNRLTIPRVVFSHWNKCNLRCRHCGAYMPDVEEPYHISSKQVLKDAELFLKSVDECLMVDITDGEPLLNPELDILLEGLIAHPKVFSIFFYTNGTVMPNERTLELLANDKVIVMISDYGFVERTAKMVSLLEKRNVHFRVMTDMRWIETDSMEDRGRSEELLKYHFLNCEAGKTRKRMAFGKLWTCTRAFRFHNMGLYTSEKDYVELLESDTDDILRQKILSLYLADTADACNFCDYGNMAANIVDAGVQDNPNLVKSQYTIIRRDELECLQSCRM